jgi:hypothetical protein
MMRGLVWLGAGALALSLAGCCKKMGPSPVSSGKCPAVFNGIPNGPNLSEYTCDCPAGGAKGPVWGTDVYTRDSALCTSAIHAGELAPSGGGTITLKPAGGCAVYKGTLQHGVTSSGWGAFNGSYYFPAHSDGKCR